MIELQKRLLGEAISLSKGLKKDRDNEMTKMMILEALFSLVQSPFDEAMTREYLLPNLEAERKALYEKCDTCDKHCGGGDVYNIDIYLNGDDELSKVKVKLHDILLKKAKQLVSVILNEQGNDTLCAALAFLGKRKHVTVEQGMELCDKVGNLG